jgi:phosphocarrier protein
MKEYTYQVVDPLGLHARPAGLLVKTAKAFKSRIIVQSGNNEADCTKLLRLMKLDAREGKTVTFSIEGDDEDAALTGIQNFCTKNL